MTKVEKKPKEGVKEERKGRMEDVKMVKNRHVIKTDVFIPFYDINGAALRLCQSRRTQTADTQVFCVSVSL